MVTLTFKFNKEKVKEAGKTEDELLQPMREHAKKYDIEETEYGVFSKDGEDAYATVLMAVPMITKQDLQFIDLLEEWTFCDNGEKEDCIEETRDWIEKHKK